MLGMALKKLYRNTLKDIYSFLLTIWSQPRNKLITCNLVLLIYYKLFAKTQGFLDSLALITSTVQNTRYYNVLLRCFIRFYGYNSVDTTRGDNFKVALQNKKVRKKTKQLN